MNKPHISTVWQGDHLGFHYKISHWGLENIHLNEGKGVWNYYVFLYESRIPDFQSLWLEPELIKITPESTGYVTYKYYDLAPAQLSWHGGVTYYAKHGELVGYRSIELGCDYSHLWDHENDFATTLDDVLYDVEQTCKELNVLYPSPS